MDKSIQEKTVRENAHKKVVGSCNRCKGKICTKKGKGVSVVKGGERRGERVCEGIAEKGLHLAIEITTNGTSILYRKKGWEEEDST